MIENEVIVYHDETKEAGSSLFKGHVLFFVPASVIIREKGGLFGTQARKIEPLNNLIKEINEIRNNFKAHHKFHFSDISGRRWAKRNCADKRVIETGIEFLRQNKGFCKLGIIFYEKPRPEHISGYGGIDKNEKKLRFEETLLRMLLKGTVHYLYDDNHKVKILKIITDGYPYHRKLNEFRILTQLINEVRDYVEIPDYAELIHLFSDHKTYDKNSEEYKHANMLQVADMLLGSVIHSCFKDAKDTKVSMKNPKIGDIIENKKGVIAYPVKEMIDKFKIRKGGFKNSKHYKAFSISKATIKNGEWEFDNVMTKEIDISNNGQFRIFNLD